MASRIDAAFAHAHEGVDEVRKGVASGEVALGVADRAFTVSDNLLGDADKGLDVLQKGVEAGWRGTKIGVGLAAVALLTGIGIGAAIAVRRRAARAAAPQFVPEPAAESSATAENGPQEA